MKIKFAILVFLIARIGSAATNPPLQGSAIYISGVEWVCGPYVPFSSYAAIAAAMPPGTINQVQTIDGSGNLWAQVLIKIGTIPPIVSPTIIPSTQPVIVTPPATQPSSGTLPTMAGETYPSDAWLATFQRDANGYLVPPKAASNAVYWRSASCPWTPPAGSLVYANFSKAQAAAYSNGSYWVWCCDGGTYTNGQDKTYGNSVPMSGEVDQNIELAGGTASRPFVIARTGPNGWNDHTYAPPKLLAGFVFGGRDYNGPGVTYLEVFGLKFYGDALDPSSKTYNKNLATNGSYQGYAFRARQLDNGSANLGYFLFSDCGIQFFGSAFDFEGNESTPSAAPQTINTVIIDHCEADHCYGQKFAGYDQCVVDLLLNDSVLAWNPWNMTVCPKNDVTARFHDWYSQAVTSPGPSDMQHRFVYSIFATAYCEGAKAGSGGLFDTDLFLANPIDSIYGGGNAVRFNNVVCDKDNAEFDSIEGGVGTSLAVTPTSNAGGARGWGLDNGGASGTAILNTLMLDKSSDGFNDSNGFALGVEGSWTYPINNNSNGSPTFTTGPTTFSATMVNNWTCTSLPSGIHVGSTPPNPNYSTSNVTWTSNASVATLPGYAKTLNMTGPQWLQAAINNDDTNFNPAYTAQAAIGWIQNQKAQGN